MVNAKDILLIVFFISGILLCLFALSLAVNEYAEYSIYKDYCNDKPKICYCSWGECTFRSVTWTKEFEGKIIGSGMDNETRQLCDLATKLKDKETLFKIGCK